MKPDHDDHAALDAFFDAARRTAPAASPDMLARVMADAGSVQATARARRPRRDRALRIPHLLGGWPSMAGLATAALAGLWIGAGLPERVLGADDAAYLVDITPEMAFDLAEGETR